MTTAWRWLGAGYCLPLFRSGYQYPGHYPDSPYFGSRNRNCPDRWGSAVQHRDRLGHVTHLPEGRKTEKRSADEYCSCAGKAADETNSFSLLHAGAHFNICQLGSTCNRRYFWFLVHDLAL